MMRLLLNENMFGWKMTGLIPKGAGWFFGFSRRSKEIAGEPRLVIYVPDGVTCAPNFDGEEHYYDRTGTTANAKLCVEDAKNDAVRYRKIRRGQHWSVIDGIGDTLRAEALDAAVDSVPDLPPNASGNQTARQGRSG